MAISNISIEIETGEENAMEEIPYQVNEVKIEGSIANIIIMSDVLLRELKKALSQALTPEQAEMIMIDILKEKNIIDDYDMDPEDEPLRW